MSDTDAAKRRVALAALDLVSSRGPIGIGTGSTANHFIDALARIRERIEAAVPSSRATAERLARLGFRVVALDEVGELPLYVDGADEVSPQRHLIKGGGGALTREKIVAAASARFVCLVDETKLVERLGRAPVPVEVIEFGRALLERAASARGARPVLRAGFVSDNGNPIVDLHELPLERPELVEVELDSLPGVLACGLFCRRPADVVLVASATGTRTL